MFGQQQDIRIRHMDGVRDFRGELCPNEIGESNGFQHCQVSAGIPYSRTCSKPRP